ncbi:hypothetical protein LIER_35579 [Lithospermum erythrorhizon]|uniref:Reverse transcriptase zinc-binding domain-containing protein n=1 Tax=Lithospermum erythrorhizon TaxID=34254 RepID=A0AAV3NSX1_LITER
MPLLSEKDDKMCWFGSRTFKTTRVYFELFENPDVVSWWKIMLFNRNMLRCGFITWIVFLRKLPTKDRAPLGWQGQQEWLLSKGCAGVEQRRGIANVVAHCIQMVQGKVVTWKGIRRTHENWLLCIDWDFDLHILKE